MDLKEESVLGDAVNTHWYYRSKAAAVLRYIAPMRPTKLLDVGAGSGFFSKELLRSGIAEEALCVDLGYEHDHQQSVEGKKVIFRSSCE